MTFGNEYSSDYAYFIAGGRTLATIKQYEANKANIKGLYAEIVDELGAKDTVGLGGNSHFTFDEPVSNPALKFDGKNKSGEYSYTPNPETPEGRNLRARLEDVPEFDLGQVIFARRLTGAEKTSTNPDKLKQGYGYKNSHYEENSVMTSATFEKYGDTYVVSVPRTIHGIFNAASAKASIDEHYEQAAGYTYQWWTPPDSTPIPYSKVIELQEKEKGDQLTERSVTKKVAVQRHAS